MNEVTCRELSITKARPNFESLILMDHLKKSRIIIALQQKMDLAYSMKHFYNKVNTIRLELSFRIMRKTLAISRLAQG